MEMGSGLHTKSAGAHSQRATLKMLPQSFITVITLSHVWTTTISLSRVFSSFHSHFSAITVLYVSVLTALLYFLSMLSRARLQNGLKNAPEEKFSQFYLVF